jgi:hypothetical protein
VDRGQDRRAPDGVAADALSKCRPRHGRPVRVVMLEIGRAGLAGEAVGVAGPG